MTNRRRCAGHALVVSLALMALGACGARSTSTTVSSDSGTTTSSAPSSIPTSMSTPGVTTPLADLHLSFTRVARIEDPISFAVRPGDDHFYVATQGGRILQIPSSSNGRSRTVLDVHKLLSKGTEQGLLGLAFDPSGTRAYIDYVDRDGDVRIDGYPLDATGRFVTSARRSILTIPHRTYANHNGGSLVVDAEGLLYIGIGDGGSGGDPDRNAQNRTTLLGKILRIDPNATATGPYGIPSDNPFIASDPMRGEIWAYGLRNPWRFSFDRGTGDLWVGDVGQSDWEEIDHVRAADGAGRGANFGWSALEGSHPFNTDQTADGAIAPVYEYSHDGSSAAVVGGYVYRGSRHADLVGTYVFADQARGTVSGLRLGANGRADVTELGRLDSVVSFGEDRNGELYVLAFGKSTGGLYRVDRA